VGWHADPLARVLVQSPTPPFAGAVDASHSEDAIIVLNTKDDVVNEVTVNPVIAE
jgi:hypothetical protein